MNDLEIEEILKRILGKHKGLKFFGVFPADHQPCIDEILHHIPCCYVMNTDSCVDPGTHWVAFLHPAPYVLEFFDSFGRSPVQLGFAIPNNFTLIYNTSAIQSENSTLCGELCIIFLYYRAHAITFNKIISQLSSKSDTLIKNIFHKLVKVI